MTTLISISKAAKILGVSLATLRAWDADGSLPAVRLPSGHRRYRLSDIEKIVNG